MTLENLTTNLVYFRHHQFIDDVPSNSSAAHYLQPGQVHELGQPYGPANETTVNLVEIFLPGSEEYLTEESSNTERGVLSEEDGVLSIIYVPTAPVLDASTGLYVSSRYLVVSSFMTLGVLLFLAYQTGRKSSQK